MIPLSDDNPTDRTPVVTILLLAAIAAVWVIVEGAGFGDRMVRSICNLGMVPGELTGLAPLGSGVPIGPGLFCAVDAEPANWASPLTSLFLHGGWVHLLGNALFLWVFGNNIEDVMGAPRFLAFYLFCGVAAAAVHILSDPSSPLPTVGASGAISGVMGAYLVLFPRVRVRMFLWFVVFYRVVAMPAWAVLIWWFAWQLLAGVFQAGAAGAATGGVAVWAHVGGFITGVVMARWFARSDLVASRRAMSLLRGRLGDAEEGA